MIDYIFYLILIQVLLLVPSFFLYRRILKKIGVTAVKEYAYLCTILFPILFTWLFIAINSTYIYPWIRSEKFDSHRWKKEENYRYRMVNDLMENKLLIGKTKKDVIELLGNTTEEGPCNNCIGYSTYEPDQGFSIDHEVLEINFDNQNKVTSVGINAW